MRLIRFLSTILLFPLILAPASWAGDAGKLTEDKAAIGHSSKPVYSPYANRGYPAYPLFGDTHLHTAYSMDAGASGTRLGPDDAYRFAKGHQVTSNTGQAVKLSRPLPGTQAFRSAWEKAIEAAEEANDPGRFTALIGFEWTSNTGGNLDRIQIVKGWMDGEGDLHEAVYDVVWADADRRQAGSDGELPPVGNTVDVDNATWTNTIGDPELIAVWEDPDFDASQSAFYYARVLEIPTPRWTAYDAKRFGVAPLPDTRMALQERAITSPIWYQPAE